MNGKLGICLLGALAVGVWADSKDGRKVEGPSWVSKPPTSEKGLYGVGIDQSKDLKQAMLRADSGACAEISHAVLAKVFGWAEKARAEGETGGLYVGLDESAAGLEVGAVSCQIQKRDQRQDADGTYRAYSLGYLGRNEAVAVVKAAQGRKLHGGASGSQDELDQAVQSTPPAGE